MEVITTNLLNYFWKNGVKPIKDAMGGKLDASKVANNLTTTGTGYALDARQGKVLNDSKLSLTSVVNNTVTTQAGYALDARQGKALEDKITALNGKLGYDANETMVTLNGWSIHYRNAGAGFIYVNITRTIQKLESSSTYIEITNLPFTVAFVQHLPITNLVAHSVVGNGIANFYGRTLACRYQEYGAAVSNEIAGLLRVV